MSRHVWTARSPPNSATSRLSREDRRMDTWTADGDYELVELDGLELTDVSASGARFLDCSLSSSVISGGDLEGTTWRGGSLTGVRLVGTRMASSTWHGV